MFRCLTLMSTMLVAGAMTATAADYPARAITMIVPFAAGGGSDATARLVVPFLEKYLPGAKIAVLNKPGAGGSIAYTEIVAAPADGYTLGMINFPDVVTGPITSSVNYAVEDFDYLGAINREPTTISVLASSPYQNLKDFLATAKEKGGSMSVAVPSLGNVHSIGLQLLSQDTGIKFNKIPFAGGGPARNALLGGHVDAAALSMGAASRKSGEIRILAQLSRERIETGKDVPTVLEETGIDVENNVVRTLAVKKGTPKDIVDQLRAAFKKAISDPELIAQAEKSSTALNYIDGDQLSQISNRLKERLTKLWETDPWMAENK